MGLFDDFYNVRNKKPTMQTDLREFGLEGRNVNYRVVIPISMEEPSNQLFFIEMLEKRLFNDKGVSFDTGSAVDQEGNVRERHWELDWSLKGRYSADEIMRYLEKQGVQFKVVIKPRQDENDWRERR